MKYILVLILVVSGTTIAHNCNAQADSIAVNNTQWNAYWIAAPNDNGTDYGIYYFRKNINFDARPASFIVHVSADNRYKLYVNGNLVSLGPARGDTYYWNYETVDLSPYLTTGKNNISAIVWNEAQYRPEAQITVRTAFILQGNSKKEEMLNSNNTWKCIRDKTHQPLWSYFAASIGEMINMNKSLKNWMTADLNNSGWLAAAQVDNGHLKGKSDGFGWMLVPSSLPQMERTYQRIPLLRKAEGINVPATLYADTEDKTSYSQHANSLAILTGMVTKADMPGFCRKLLGDSSLTQCTIYFKYYLHMALVKGGLGDDYQNWLGVWRNNIKMGLTTWAEESNLQTTRSD